MWNLIFAFAVGSSFAADKFASYPAQKISLRGVTDIKVVGVKGNLKLQGRKHTEFVNLKVRHSAGKKDSDWHLSVDRQGHTLVLEVFNVAYGAQWRKVVRQELWPEFDIELDGKSLPTSVGWREGTITISEWDSDLDLSFLKGQVSVNGGSGKLNLQATQGIIQVTGRKGAVDLKGESGAVNLKQLQGPSQINWLEGQISVENAEGPVKIESRNSEVDAKGVTKAFSLKLEGGRARISASAPSDLNIISTTGSVDVEWKTGGCKVFLTSTHGSIVTGKSNFLELSRREGRQVAEGTKKAKPMGEVFVRTDSGAIRWRP